MRNMMMGVCVSALVAVLLSGLLSGCIFVVKDVPKPGDPFKQPDERTVARMSRDGQITSALMEIFKKDERLKDFEVRAETRDGVVTLTGHVLNHDIELHAVALAQANPHVRGVISRMNLHP